MAEIRGELSYRANGWLKIALRLAIVLPLVTESAVAQRGQMTGITEKSGVPPVKELSAKAPNVIAWERPFDYSGSEFLRLFFTKIVDRTAGSYKIKIVDRFGYTLKEISKREFEERGSYVTGEIPSSYADVQVVNVDGGDVSGLSFELSEIAFSVSSAVTLSIPATGSDLQSITDLGWDRELMKVAKSVGRLSIGKIDSDGLRKIFSCSGFLVADEILVTNQHCVRDQDDCLATVVYFDLLPDEATQRVRETPLHEGDRFGLPTGFCYTAA
jgi:hypothetical protein